MNTGQVFLGVVTAIAAVSAALLAWWAGAAATGQREHQARREEWWRRFQWATDMAISTDERKARVGLALLVALSDSGLAGTDELDAMAGVADEIYEMPVAIREGRRDDEFIQIGPGEQEGRIDGDPGDEVAGDGGPAESQD